MRNVLDGARRAAGGGAALAATLRQAGVGPDAGAYSESAVSNWIKGRTRPPADVVLAAASLYGLSLDRSLGIKAEDPEGNGQAGDRPTGDLEQLRADLSTLEATVRAHLAQPVADARDGVKDVVAVYATRAETQAAAPLVRILAAAERVDLMGLSLNGLCQGISDVTLRELIENGLHLRCLFLDPDGEGIKAREAEERVPGNHLAELTRTNLHAIGRLRSHLSPQAIDRLQVRTYDQTIRFNITVVDNQRALVQPYLHQARGLDSPTLMIEADQSQPHGLFPIFEQAFSNAWQGGRDVEP